MKLSDWQKIEIVEKYLTGKYTCASLGREYDVAPTTIKSVLKVRSVKINNNISELKRKYTLNQNYFDIIDTEEKAYFLGLLYADGCNQESRHFISIVLQERDKEILEKFRIAINTNKPLYFWKRTKPHRKDAYALNLSSKHMSKRLAELGCVQRKSLILKFPTEEQVPNHLISHFVRGYFDGDGHFGVFDRGERYKFYSFHITSNGEFLQPLIGMVMDKIGIRSSILSNHTEKSTRKFWVGGRLQIFKMLDWLYKDATIYLKRKHDLYINSDIRQKDGIYEPRKPYKRLRKTLQPAIAR